jgi:hypothetical protein
MATEGATTVAALYVERGGVYFGLPGVDPWDEERDARLYAGPWPVVAHPPCAKWSSLAFINQSRLPGYVIGDDGGCFEAALHAVRMFGGVLEHPAKSLAWKRFGLTKPLAFGYGWLFDGDAWTCRVSQAAYGHRAFKETWLYFIGPEPPELDWSRPEVSARVSSFTHGKPRLESERVRPAEASRTPLAFRDVLLGLARSASRQEVAA